ncbi:MAG: DUF1631 domain-containing protein [Halomonadaceae bacterium]|nr:MAG: DUF1631 domain-containing protein [Halomonadaceae bacterium]
MFFTETPKRFAGMNREGKDVQLPDSDGLISGMPDALRRLRDLSMVQSKQLLAGFFEQSDDALFDLADKAGSHEQHNLYFDAMRELRLQRRELTLCFQQWLARAFNECLNPAPELPPEPAPAGPVSLALVAHETMEEQLAISAMVNKVRHYYGEPVEMIRLRMQTLLRVDDLRATRNPLAPEVICQGLAEACAELTMDLRSKLVVYKLFDKLLIRELKHLYSLANQLLIREGVLPDMRQPPVGKVPGPRAHDRPRQPSTEKPMVEQAPDKAHQRVADSHAPGFNDLSALLRAGQPLATAAEGVRPACVAMTTNALLQQLSSLQHDLGSGFMGPPGARGSRLKEQLLNLPVVSEHPAQAPGQVDGDVINLVSMLFDFILDDRHVPEPMKGQLVRLQIPILKVALIDRSFFQRGGHPARQLLNALATAALGWGERLPGEPDLLGERITGVVDRICQEFTDDVSLFAVVLEDFSRFNDQQQRREQLLQRRLRDAEEGRARHEQSQEVVSRLLAELEADHQLPATLAKLLHDPWRRVLQWFWLRLGEGSEEWQEMTRLTGLLIWSGDPQPVTRGTRNELLRQIPDIVDGVRRGLNAIAWDPFAIDEWVRKLELLHVAALHQLATGEAAPVKEPGSATPVKAVSVEAAPPAAEEPHPAWMARARSLQVGGWVEWHNGESRHIRCKLAAVIKASGRYIFVNRSGAKVMEYSETDLANALSQGVITPLDDSLIFDRALESVIDELRFSRRR